MLLTLLAAAVSVAPVQERRPPEFRADVRMIRLDVSVVDGEGRSVAGLLAEDFTVAEDGRPVEVAFFEAVEPLGASAADAASPARSRVAGSSRRVVLLVDAASMSNAQLIRARESAARYVREATSDGDWVRLVNLSTGRALDGRIPEDRSFLESAASAMVRGGSLWASAGRITDPIEDREETGSQSFGLLEAAELAAGFSTEAYTSGRFLSVFAESSGLLGTLESLLVQLDGVEGRKALVLISPGFPQLRDLERRLQRVASLAREASTAVYFVDAVGLDGLIPEPGQKLVPAFEAAWARSGGAQDLAEATGGFTSRFANSLFAALARVSGEMRTYYVIGYVPPRPEDGRFRSVKVRVNVPGVKARTKKGYLAGLPR